MGQRMRTLASEAKPSYYDVLGIPVSANEEQIKRAYYQMAKKFHPDLSGPNKNHANEHLKLINEAYSLLKDKEKRQKYNKYMERKKNVFSSRQNYANNNAAYSNIFSKIKDRFWPVINENKAR